MKFGTFKKHSLAEEIAQKILVLIQEKELRPGDRLPPVRELATMMQVSVPSLREALRTLSFMNVVEIRQGSGTYVTSLKPELLVEHLDFVLSLDDSLYTQVFQTRKILEVGIAAIAAQQITDEEIADLESIVERTAAAINHPESFYQFDVELHDTIIRSTRNQILIQLMLGIRRLNEESRRRTLGLGDLDAGLEQHRAIVTAVKSRDPEAARQAMLSHLNHSEGQLKELLLSEA